MVQEFEQQQYWHLSPIGPIEPIAPYWYWLVLPGPSMYDRQYNRQSNRQYNTNTIGAWAVYQHRV